jgi:hypothetical protein
MAWIDSVSDIVSRYTSAGGAATAPADPHQDYLNVARQAPQPVIADALAHTFRSDQTPSFPEMVSNLFRGSSPNQQAGLLNQLIGSIGPAALTRTPWLRSIATTSGGMPNLGPQAASQVTAEQVQQLADHAERSNPSVVDQVSTFYAQHPGVVKMLGGAAITLAIRHMVQRKA